MRIEACFDSHVHFAATGEFSQRLNLKNLKSAADVLSLKVEPGHHRGDWILGFGWDESSWPEPPTHEILDRWQPDHPVALSRIDGHALWLNQAAMKLLKLDANTPDVEGGRILRLADGQPTGVLIDRATEAAHALIPAPSSLELRRHLLKATQIFNNAGFTHIRDMTTNLAQFSEMVRLDQSGLLTLAVETYFWVKDPDDLENVLAEIETARTLITPNLRIGGVKLFLDGSLGSESAWLSRCYCGREHAGLTLWQKADFARALRLAWGKNLAVAVHAIGDAAADHLADVALGLKSQSTTGPLHLEHGELIRPETITKLKTLDASVHLQPAHWLSDQHWLKEKLGDLATNAFPWRRLQEAEVQFDFGSDSPMAKPSVADMITALNESAAVGIPRLLGSPERYLQHQDLSWAPNSFTLFVDGQPSQIIFRGEHIN